METRTTLARKENSEFIVKDTHTSDCFKSLCLAKWDAYILIKFKRKEYLTLKYIGTMFKCHYNLF